METRALAIAFFYAIGTAVGGISGSLLFDNLVKSGDRAPVSIALFVGTGVITLVGVIEVFFGVKAERAKLEDIAMPLTAADAEKNWVFRCPGGRGEGGAAAGEEGTRR